jgi:FAD-linked oxidoreductase
MQKHDRGTAVSAKGLIDGRGRWTNWSGGVTCEPGAVAAPKDEAELAAAMRQAKAPVRSPGAGHSFTPLNATDGTLIDLAAFHGRRGVDHERRVVTFGAATPIWMAGPLAHSVGYALKNQGDVDRQTLGGAVGTGTHGTGPTFGSLSAEVAGFRLMQADGNVVECTASENPEIFAAGRCAMGLFGVMTEISMHMRPASGLVEREFLLPVDELFARLDELIAGSLHFEFFWFPYADKAICKTLNETREGLGAPQSAEELFAAGEGGDAVTAALSAAFAVLPHAPVLLGPAHRTFTRLLTGAGRIGWSHEIFPTARPFKFTEMEYAVPAEQGPSAVKEVVATIRKRRINTGFPVEYRTVAADDVWLSPFYERPSATIAVHQSRHASDVELFAASEAVFRAHDGRPHWGKKHTRTAAELAGLYPRYGHFCELRRKLDPDGKFLNPYLRTLFA